jgi:hypothetical protein
LLIVYKYLSSRLDHPNLSVESATVWLPCVPPRIAYLDFVIFNVGFGLILNWFSLEEYLNALADALDSNKQRESHHLAVLWWAEEL